MPMVEINNINRSIADIRGALVSIKSEDRTKNQNEVIGLMEREVDQFEEATIVLKTLIQRENGEKTEEEKT